MSTPSRKTEILEEIRATHQPLEALLTMPDDARMTQSGAMGEWSVKDTLAHITWWEQHLLRRMRTGRDDVYDGAVDDRATTDRTNAEVFAANRERPLGDVLAAFHASYQELLSALEGMSEDELAPEEIYDAIRADTFGHYPEHTGALQAWLPGGAQERS
jgi:uncharacterized damage-inducible protein DinB